MSKQPTCSADYFSEDSPFIGVWPRFTVRAEQQALAQHIETALQERAPVALEAPTGTGKTLAYLLPALLHSSRVIISVGNRTLQDHLWWGEYQKLKLAVPQLRPLTVLKGCENYVCRWRLDEGLQNGTAWIAEHWHQIASGLQQSRSGEIIQLPLPEAARNMAHQHLAVTADQCLGQRCRHFEDCFFQQARSRAMQADVLLINHTLLLSDKRLFEKGMGELLPLADSIIVDEAHQLPDMLVRFNTEMLDGYRLQRWIRQLRKQCNEHFSVFPALKNQVMQLESLWSSIQLQIVQHNVDGLVPVAAQSVLPLLKRLFSLEQHLRQSPLSAVALETVLENVVQWRQMLGHAISEEQTLYADMSGQWLRLIAGRVHSPFATLAQAQLNWIFISATLAVERSFAYFKRMLDLPQLTVRRFEGELDYVRQALLWVPDTLPEPSTSEFALAWVNTLVDVATQLDGGMLLLFSSHEALQQSAELLRGRTDRQLLVHLPGTNRQSLLQQFRQDGQSLLLATGSFWEGIDVAGASLRCVAIDKLPFAPPDDILALAWKHMAVQSGQQVFNDFMVPQAITRLRQGVGRLLRSPEDCGLVLLGDTRILRKSYGPRFLSSLPPVPMAHSLQEVERYFHTRGIAKSG